MSPVTTRSSLASERLQLSRAAARSRGLGAVPTRSPRHQTSSTDWSSMSPSTASKAGRFPWTLRAGRCASRASTVSGDGAFAASACVRRHGGRRRRGDVPAPAAQRPDRARPGSRRTVLHTFSARPGRGFRSVQRLLGVAGIGVGIGTLAILAWRPPIGVMDRLARRPLLGGAAAGAGISLVLIVTGLPISAWSRARSLDVGLATQSWPDWAVDVVKAAGISAVTAAIGGLIAMALVGRFPRRWWAPAAVPGARLRRRDHLAVPDPDRPGVQQVRPAAGGQAAPPCAPACRPRRRGRGRRVPRGRQPPHERGQRVRGRPRAQQARGAVRQPDRRLQPGRGAHRGRRRAGAPEATTTSCAGSRGSRSLRPPAPSSSALAERFRPAGRAADAVRRSRRSRWRSRW